MKIAINRKYGGFSLSHKAVMRYAELKGITVYPYEYDLKTQACVPLIDESKIDNKSLLPMIHYCKSPIKDGKSKDGDSFYDGDFERHDPLLIQVIEELGSNANGGSVADIKIIDIPDDVEYTIEEYDGIEWVAEKHRMWP